MEMTDTHRVIADMLQENTGTHLLDSGGYYGRAWQRNQARLAALEEAGQLEEIPEGDRAAAMWMGQPRAWMEGGRHGGYVTLSVFHYLAERLTFLPKLDRMFRLWVQMDGTSNQWDDGRRFYNSSGTVDDFAARMVARGMFSRDGEWAGASGYTYNHENALSQDVVYTICQLADVFYGDENMRERIDRLEASCGDYVVGISIHNGCDARGGFTDTRWFLVDGGWDGVADLFDWDGFEAWCEGSQTPREIPGQARLDGTLANEMLCDGQWSHRGELIGPDGTGPDDSWGLERSWDLPWEWDDEREVHVCVKCHLPMHVDAPYVG